MARILALRGIKARFPEASARERLGFGEEKLMLPGEYGLLDRLGVSGERFAWRLNRLARAWTAAASYRVQLLNRHIAYYLREITWVQKHW
ncbi:MAG: hypothetical protein GXO65_04920 [Euryarchaeota archaeon]|nr:hypothetical protein [Euryarchaeota archaeon]